ncbi:MAG: hypothetical protein DWQ35_00075 [Planctomycetota bacterium]|nr:MAG: hypothetical protein DWQ35_00075 [Planctomycetota bacterium]REK46801.1 MAG: hypothetical protein DWQ46_05810 [Planctomycetota bacterium]
MTWHRDSRSVVSIAVGVAVLAIGIAAGTLVTVALTSPSSGTLVQATATHGIDKFAIATGQLDESTEAIYFLDFLTLELKGAALSRQTAKFTTLYKRNIANDFRGSTGDRDLKNPRFLLVTGLGNLQQRGGDRIAKAVVYVVEVNSGLCAAYATPERRSRRATGTTSTDELILLHVLPLRREGAVRS